MFISSPKDLAISLMLQRKKLKLSQAKVGRLVGLKQQTISEFELRPEGTQLDTLFRILSALELTIQLNAKNKGAGTKTPWKEEW